MKSYCSATKSFVSIFFNKIQRDNSWLNVFKPWHIFMWYVTKAKTKSIDVLYFLFYSLKYLTHLTLLVEIISFCGEKTLSKDFFFFFFEYPKSHVTNGKQSNKCYKSIYGMTKWKYFQYSTIQYFTIVFIGNNSFLRFNKFIVGLSKIWWLRTTRPYHKLLNKTDKKDFCV